MRITSLSRMQGAKFIHAIGADEFESTLEMPTGKDPSQNAWLTITVNYSFNFIDSKSSTSGLHVRQDGRSFGRDLDGKLFPLKDWDMASISEFVRKFQKGESFWNHKFLLVTPRDYDAFDFTSMAGTGWVCRPNVLCLLRLRSGGSPNHLPINVVRTGDTNFRSSHFTYDDQDVNNKTLWHELGHALDQLHIRALFGDQKCFVEVNHDDCYKEPPGVAPNIQGSGTGLLPQNAKAWHELIARHTETPQTKWQVSMATNTPPRKMPLGFDVRGVMPSQW